MADRWQFRDVALMGQDATLVFASFSLNVAAGERLRVLPEAGCGSTALLRLAAGLAQPQSGSVLLDDRPFDPWGPSHPTLRRGSLAWVPTNGGLLVNQSLLANVMLPLRFVKGMGFKEAECHALEALARAELASQAGRRPHTVDAKDRWLTALARGWAMDAELWLIDRPPSLLDDDTTRLAQTLLGDLFRHPRTTALVVDPLEGWSQGLQECLRNEGQAWIRGGAP